jgi:hypothetical protein
MLLRLKTSLTHIPFGSGRFFYGPGQEIDLVLTVNFQ